RIDIFVRCLAGRASPEQSRGQWTVLLCVPCVCRTNNRIGRTHAISAIPLLTFACQQKATDSRCAWRKNPCGMQMRRRGHKEAAVTDLVTAASHGVGVRAARVSDAAR